MQPLHREHRRARRMAFGLTLAMAGSTCMAQAPNLEPIAKPDLSAYWVAYVHFDPFAERYVLDAVAPGRDPNAEAQSALSGSEILAIARDGTRVQALYTERFEYRYKRALGDVVDDPASRVVTAYPCNLSDGVPDISRVRHPCGSRFTKPARMEYWPTLGGMMAGRPGDLSAFSIAVPNPKELARALEETGLRERLAEPPSALDVKTTAAPLQWQQPLLVEAFGSTFRMDEVRFLTANVPAPEDARIVLRGEANLWGRTVVPLSEVRQVRIVEERASQCPMVQVKLKAGEAKQFSRCNGSPFSAEVNGKLVELEVLRGRGLQVKDGRAAARAAAPFQSFWLPVGRVPRQSPQLLPLTSLGALTPEEAERMDKR